jgi:hypothetical protein
MTMTTIIANQATTVTVTLKANGAPVTVPTGATVTAQLFDIGTGAALFSPAKTLASTDVGSAWATGVVAVALTSGDTASVAPPDAMLAIVVNGKTYRFRLQVEVANAAPTKSALFIRDFAIDEIRADRLYAVAETLMPGVPISDDYIWSKVVAAEADVKHTLRVPLVPTTFFPVTPTQQQIDALGGMPWAEDPAYDYDPMMFQADRWGFINARNKPIISVTSLRYAYPSQNDFAFDVPAEWIRLDKKYGQVRIVPNTTASIALLGNFMISLIGAGRTIPHIMHLTYVAGLTNAARDYPELLDVIKKLAVLKIIEDGFLPQSGSISADGLSQSMSVDMGKYHDSVDMILNGPKGSNGGLMAAIHGIRLGVV